MEQLNPILPDINEVEEWRVCAEYPAYEVSSFGRVKNIKTKNILKPRTNSERMYQLVHLRTGVPIKNGKYAYIHRLVAEAFCEKLSDEQDQIDHIDRRRNNNYYKNLQWATRSENLKNKGKGHSEYVYKERTPIVLLDKETNELIAEYDSPNQAGEELGLSPVQIVKNIHGRRLDFKNGYFMTKKNFDNMSDET